MADVVTETENALMAVVSVWMIPVAQIEVGVMIQCVAERTEVFVISEDSDADEVICVSDLDHESVFLSRTLPLRKDGCGGSCGGYAHCRCSRILSVGAKDSS